MARRKNDISTRKLAKLFLKYDFFNDDKPVDEAYGILCEVYSALDNDSKHRLHVDYDIAKTLAECKKRYREVHS